uniref:Photosystem II 5 kDa protein, chloroplastic n=1 Tax=Petunia hybrida TaxID=4102 RepID=PST2_PETHY|nr:RecName: Full=Photosystem II 5 kDa protein, chloroplastic; Flags: Precursor [Petunia x hybrida]
MASITMMSSFLGGSTVAPAKVPSANRRGVVMVKAMHEGENNVVISKNEESKNSGRRELFFAMAAAAACSVAKTAMADEEPKRGTPEAKKKYSSVCVTNPTARICRY